MYGVYDVKEKEKGGKVMEWLFLGTLLVEYIKEVWEEIIDE